MKLHNVLKQFIPICSIDNLRIPAETIDDEEAKAKYKTMSTEMRKKIADNTQLNTIKVLMTYEDVRHKNKYQNGVEIVS